MTSNRYSEGELRKQLGGIRGRIGHAPTEERKQERIKEYNDLARQYNYKDYTEGEPMGPIEPENNIVPRKLKKRGGGVKKGGIKKAPRKIKIIPGKKAPEKKKETIGTVPQVIRKQVDRGTTAVKKSQLTKEILEYEENKQKKKVRKTFDDLDTIQKAKIRRAKK